MNLALITLCQPKINYQQTPQISTKPVSTQRFNGILSTYEINVLAAIGELTLGLPLDRIKIELQSGAMYREIFKRMLGTLAPLHEHNSSQILSSQRFPTGVQQRFPTGVQQRFPTGVQQRFPTGVQQRFRNNISYWFAGHTPSIINRCFIYLPGISYLNTKYTKHIEPWVCWIAGCPTYVSQTLFKPALVSALISPYVALFEGLKLTQQLGFQRVYPTEIHKFISVLATNQRNTQTFEPTTYQLIRGVVNSGRSTILFASFWPTFARETAFISGMCAIQPRATQYIIGSRHLDNPESARVLGSLVASFACQTISQPFDVLKTRREYRPADNWPQLIEHLKIDIKNKSVRTVLFSGWLPRCIRGVWTFYSVSAIRDWLSK